MKAEAPSGGWLSPLRAELRKLMSRRAVRIIGVVALVGLVWLSWSNHKAAPAARTSIDRIEKALTDVGSFERARADPRAGAFGHTEAEFRQNLEFQLHFSQDKLTRAQVLLHPHNSHEILLDFFGTLPGVILAILLASTFIGAEFRWGYVKTSLTNQPRRGRLIVTKLLALWITLGVSLAALLILSYPVNAGFAKVFDLRAPAAVQPELPNLGFPDPSGAPDLPSLLGQLGVAWLTLGFYSTVAFAAVAWTRATLAGPLTSLGLLASEGGFFTRTWTQLRYVVPSQQIAFLRPEIPMIGFGTVPGGIWYERLDSIRSFVVLGPGQVDLQELSSIPDWRALLVLAVWVAVVVAASVIALRRRDVPG